MNNTMNEKVTGIRTRLLNTMKRQQQALDKTEAEYEQLGLLLENQKEQTPKK